MAAPRRRRAQYSSSEAKQGFQKFERKKKFFQDWKNFPKVVETMLPANGGRSKEAFPEKEKVSRSVGAKFPDFGKRQRLQIRWNKTSRKCQQGVGARFPDFGRAGKSELEQNFQILEEQEKSELEQNFQILEERVSSFVGAKFPDFGKGMYFQCGWGLTLKI